MVEYVSQIAVIWSIFYRKQVFPIENQARNGYTLDIGLVLCRRDTKTGTLKRDSKTKPQFVSETALPLAAFPY